MAIETSEEPEGNTAARWYAVHTLPSREPIAVSQLERQGFRTFLPKTIVTRRHARRFETRVVSLFPRYAFVQLDLGLQRWRSINGTIGVASIVMGRDLPSAVPKGIVEELMAASDVEGVVDADRGFRPGDSVLIATGPFAGAIGTLLRLDARGRVDMLLSIMAGSVRLTVERTSLRPAS